MICVAHTTKPVCSRQVLLQNTFWLQLAIFLTKRWEFIKRFVLNLHTYYISVHIIVLEA